MQLHFTIHSDDDDQLAMLAQAFARDLQSFQRLLVLMADRYGQEWLQAQLAELENSQ